MSESESHWGSLRSTLLGWNLVDNVWGIQEVWEVPSGMLKMRFALGDGRSQEVFLLATDEHEDWVAIDSIFGAAASVDTNQIIPIIDGRTGIAIAAMGGALVTRRMLPLQDLSTANLLISIKVVALVADELESKVSGGDRF